MNNTDQVKILRVARESNESSVDNEVDPQIDILTTNTRWDVIQTRLTAEKTLVMEDENTAKLEVKRADLVEKAKVSQAVAAIPKRDTQGQVIRQLIELEL